MGTFFSKLLLYAFHPSVMGVKLYARFDGVLSNPVRLEIKKALLVYHIKTKHNSFSTK